MIRDYFERKKIWLSSSPGHIGLAFIVLLVTTLCGMLGFVFAGFLFILSIAVFRSLEINELLPFSKKERKTRFLTEVMLDLLCLSVPLLINTKNEILNSTTTFGGGIYSRTVKVYSFI